MKKELIEDQVIRMKEVLKRNRSKSDYYATKAVSAKKELERLKAILLEMEK